MNGASKINFDAVHTLEKQQFLAQKMTEVSEQIHARFPPLLPLEACPCCGSKNHTFYVEKFHFRMDQCTECQHIFTNPMPSDAALNYYYNSDLKTFENKFFNDSRQARIQIFTDRLIEIRKHVSGDQLLDIGSAVGIFLDANRLSDQPFQITSCDLNAEACAYIRTHYEEVQVIHSDVMQLTEDRRFDCITLWDTIEHIVNPIALLRKLGDLLNPDGVLCFSTPNTDSFEWRIMGEEHVQLLPPGHVNLYNTGNIHTVMKAAGFTIESLQTPNASLDVSYVKKMLENEKSIAFPNGKEGPRERLSQILNDAFWHSNAVEDALIQFLKEKRNAGNMLVIARKT